MLLYNNLNFQGWEARSLRLHNASADPTVDNGGIYYKTTDHRLRVKINGVWKKLVTSNEGTGGIDASEISLPVGELLVGNASGYAQATSAAAISVSAFGAAIANISLGGFKITNSADPSAGTDLASKAYVDAQVSGSVPREAVLLATAIALPTYGVIGNELTAIANGILTIDGTTALAGSRVLIKDEGSSPDKRMYNGVYVVTAEGTAGTPWVLTRAADADTAVEITAAVVFVTSGTVNAFTSWGLSTTSITLNTTPLVWVQTSGSAEYSAGNGLVRAGSVFHFARSSNYVTGELFYANGLSSVASTGHPGVAQRLLTSLVGPNRVGFSTWTIPASFTANAFLIADSSGNIIGSAIGNNQIVTTNGTGVPTLTTSLPSGTTVNGVAIYLVGGTDISLTDGGTGTDLSSAGATGGLVYKASGSALNVSAAGTAGQFARSGGSGAPTWSAYSMPSTLTGANSLFVSASTSVVNELVTTASRFLQTDASGVISWGGVLNPAKTVVGVGRKYSALVTGDGTTKITVTHGLNTRDVIWSVRLGSSGDTTFPKEFALTKVEVNNTSANQLDLYFGAAQTASDYFVVTIVG